LIDYICNKFSNREKITPLGIDPSLICEIGGASEEELMHSRMAKMEILNPG